MLAWGKTKAAVKDLGEILRCNICKCMLKDPYSLKNCEHSFCRICITKAVNENSKCPDCGSFAWLKDLKINRELASAVDFCSGIKNAIAMEKQEGDTSVEITGSMAGIIENVDKEATEDCESWPLSGKQPKKAIKTYGKKQNQPSRPPNLPIASVYEKISSLDKNDITMSSKFEGLNVYDESLVLETENKFFRDVDNADEKDDFDEDLSVIKSDLPEKRMRKRRYHEEFGKNNEKKMSAGYKEENSNGQSRKPAGLENKRKQRDKERTSSSITKVNKKGEAPLHVAAIKGKYDQVEELLGKGADPNAKDFAGWTPLHEACNHGCLEIVQLLLDNGAFIDVPGCDHDTPLHDAIANSRLDVAEFLVSKGASVDVRNKQGLSPMDYVRSNAVKEQLMLAAQMAKENEEANVSNLASGRVKTENSLLKCILYTGLDKKEKKALEKCAKNLGAKLVDQFNNEVTHVIATVDDERKCSRTMKYLLGVLTGKWVISLQWAIESLAKNKWVDEEKFEVKGCPEACDFIPKKARINAAKQFPLLFDGCSFYFSGEFQSNPSKPELLELIRCGGGRILHREPKAETSHPLITPSSPAVLKMMPSKVLDAPVVAYHAKPNTAQSYCTQFIIFDPESCPHHKRLSTPIMCTVTPSWILDCISNFEIVEV